MAFENASEQPVAVRFLMSQLRAGRLPHALLFVGSPGTGRLALARELARVLLCVEATPDDYCGGCESCRAISSGNHPDYEEISVPEGRQLLPIDSIREVQHIAALKPRASAGRVFVIRDAERMSLEAANCFLKTLEEPAGPSHFILLAAALRDIPPTIVSRCQVVRFRNLPHEVLTERLREQGLEPEDAWWLARRSWGSPGEAERFLAEGLHRFNRELADRLAQLSEKDNFELSDRLNSRAGEEADSASEARETLQDLLECAALYYRDAALAAACPRKTDALFNQGARERIVERTSGRSADLFLDQADLVLDGIQKLGANANRTLTLDHLFTELDRRERRNR